MSGAPLLALTDLDVRPDEHHHHSTWRQLSEEGTRLAWQGTRRAMRRANGHFLTYFCDEYADGWEQCAE